MGRELWKSDGTGPGSVLVRDIFPGSGSGVVGAHFASDGDAIFFVASDGLMGQELWRSDGSAAGTRLVKDVVPGNNALGAGSACAVDRRRRGPRGEPAHHDADVPGRSVTAVTHPVTVQFATTAGTARAWLDYWPTSGTLTLPAGMTTASVPVSVW